MDSEQKTLMSCTEIPNWSPHKYSERLPLAEESLAEEVLIQCTPLIFQASRNPYRIMEEFIGTLGLFTKQICQYHPLLKYSRTLKSTFVSKTCKSQSFFSYFTLGIFPAACPIPGLCCRLQSCWIIYDLQKDPAASCYLAVGTLRDLGCWFFSLPESLCPEVSTSSFLTSSWYQLWNSLLLQRDWWDIYSFSFHLLIALLSNSFGPFTNKYLPITVVHIERHVV